MQQQIIVSILCDWFLKSKRTFPWRENKNAYRVMVSEVMLQQTQALRVIPYFLRWMHRFETIQDLACATEDEVIHMWEGLGYYSRARALYKAAKYIVEKYDGYIPQTRKELLFIPGIGPYTAGAILSFAFSIPTPAIDANVLRVISRLYNICEVITSKSAVKKIEAIVLQLLQSDCSYQLMEALIELGALICVKKPHCSICPLQQVCVSYQQGVHELRPVMKTPPLRQHLHRLVVVNYAKKGNCVLVLRRQGKKVMSGLYEFPFIEMQKEEVVVDSQRTIAFMTQHNFLKEYISLQSMPCIKQSFTRYSATLYPYLVQIDEPFKYIHDDDEVHWISLCRLDNIPFSAGHRKLADRVYSSLAQKRLI